MNRTERQVIAALAALIEREEKQLSKLRLIAWALSMAGGLLLGFSLIPAIQSQDGGWFLGFGAVAGVLIGVSVLYFSSVAQWPVVKRFMNAEAVKDANSGEQP